MTTKDFSRIIDTDDEVAYPKGFVRYDEDSQLPGEMIYNIAPKYTESETYAVGDLVIYKGTLYKATGSSTGAFDPTKWAKTTIAAEIAL